MKALCLACQGTGIGHGERAVFGELMNLCSKCDGRGLTSTDDWQANPDDRPFIAIFPVSARYMVHMAVPRRKGGIVPMSIHWSPKVPPETGKWKLTLAEKRAYESGRNAALAALQHQLGGGEWSVLNKTEIH